MVQQLANPGNKIATECISIGFCFSIYHSQLTKTPKRCDEGKVIYLYHKNDNPIAEMRANLCQFVNLQCNIVSNHTYQNGFWFTLGAQYYGSNIV
jgi:hypothetical protein